MRPRLYLWILFGVIFLGTLAVSGRIAVLEAHAQSLSNSTISAAQAPSRIRNTRHNLSSSAPTRVYTTAGNALATEPTVQAGAGVANDEICVYCHTPHGASTSPGTPLWNRTLSGATYTAYSSSSIQATDINVTDAALAAPSKLCLSCHDGTMAIGSVINAPGSGAGSTISLSNLSSGGMPFGRGRPDANHGFTRRLGTDLRNDHPISFTYDTTLATNPADKDELRDPATSASPTIIANRSSTVKPHFPLTGGKVQCTTCHDPHKETQKFLRKNRMQTTAPEGIQSIYTNWVFNDNNDQICLGCHTKLGKAWAVSAHANSGVATPTYNPADAAMRDFPTGTTVWQAACLNCHDTHTVGGSRRLLREGVSGTLTTGGAGYSASFRLGFSGAAAYDTTSALENTCYQCHSSSPVITPVTLTASGGVPDIASEFARPVRMPITNAEQGLAGGNANEVHDITNADFSETQANLGYQAVGKRHVECTDCHNPHRVVKGDTFLGGNLAGGSTTRRTHVPARGTTGNEGNIASGVLRGAWGVEPGYTISGATSWPENPTFTVKNGDPGAASSLPVGSAGTSSATYLTREYQLCFKCHSNYANDTTAANYPSLGRTGGTVSGKNSMTKYTNVAGEFAVRATDPPTSSLDQGEITNSGTACGGGDCVPSPVGSTTNNTAGAGAGPAATGNHRSWHPVVFPTGRTPTERGSASFGNIRPPFNQSGKIGLQTMHCSDCHGSAESWTQGADATDTANGPNLSQVQGPHGSGNPFLLKGIWNDGSTGNTPTTTPSAVSGGNSGGHICGRCHSPSNTTSGFAGSTEASHGFSPKQGFRCMACHIAVPHGWKNKAFLVNLNCVGPEISGYATGCTAVGTTSTETLAPYYNRALLRVNTWNRSGNWAENSCGPMSGTVGKDWMSSACGF